MRNLGLKSSKSIQSNNNLKIRNFRIYSPQSCIFRTFKMCNISHDDRNIGLADAGLSKITCSALPIFLKLKHFYVLIFL
jgi:hypothetical protein